MASLTGDRPPAVLIDLYKSYRACARAKVNALRADQLTGSEREAAAEASARHLEFANSYVQRWARPLVIVVGGLSGTGKSTLAAKLADSLGCELLGAGWHIFDGRGTPCYRRCPGVHIKDSAKAS